MHLSQALTPVRTSLTMPSHPDSVATSSGLYPSHNITERLEFSSITPTTIPNPTTPHITPTKTPTAPTVPHVVLANRLFTLNFLCFY